MRDEWTPPTGDLTPPGSPQPEDSVLAEALNRVLDRAIARMELPGDRCER